MTKEEQIFDTHYKKYLDSGFINDNDYTIIKDYYITYSKNILQGYNPLPKKLAELSRIEVTKLENKGIEISSDPDFQIEYINKIIKKIHNSFETPTEEEKLIVEIYNNRLKIRLMTIGFTKMAY